MRRWTLGALAIAIPGLLMAQWQDVSDGLGNLSVRSMFTFVDTLMVGTANGIFRSADQGESWSDISGDIGSRDIHDIRGGGGPRTLWAATADGAFFTLDQTTWLDHTATGLPTSNLSYYWFGDHEVEEADWAIGTVGGGVFTGPELSGPWTAANNGLAGDALTIRDLSGYSDNGLSYAALATDGGLYVSFDHMVSWIPRNADLTGEALRMRRLVLLGSGVLVATQGGLYLSMNQGESYMPLWPGPRFNTVYYGPVVGLLAFGQVGIFSNNFITFQSIDMEGVSGGDVTCMAVGASHVFIGTESGGVYRRSLDQFSAVAEQGGMPAGHRLLASHPNPFNPTTTLNYVLAAPGQVELVIHDLRGRTLATLVDAAQAAGFHQATFTAEGLPSGLYFCRLLVDGRPVETQRLLLVR